MSKNDRPDEGAWFAKFIGDNSGLIGAIVIVLFVGALIWSIIQSIL
ncbi:hypothetical protein [Bifidobacterium sp. SO1]|nr:hypothetical protein [Bifidobacterium sp. SO1]MBT1162138.1 hypothetical protein [Bifidobacterium sp. SO1]